MSSASDLRCSNSPASGSVAAKSTMVATRAGSTAIYQLRMMVRGPRLVGIGAIKHRDGVAESVGERSDVDADAHIKLRLAWQKAGDNAQVRARIVGAHGLDHSRSVLFPIRT